MCFAPEMWGPASFFQRGQASPPPNPQNPPSLQQSLSCTQGYNKDPSPYNSGTALLLVYVRKLLSFV